MNGSDGSAPPFPFDMRHCELAQTMKEKGLRWTPYPGCYVYDPEGRIGLSSPFADRIYFILDLKHFVRRLGSAEDVAAGLVWLPTVEQALWLCGQLEADPSGGRAPALASGDIWTDPGTWLISLYQTIIAGLEKKNGQRICRPRPDNNETDQAGLTMCGPLDMIEDRPAGEDDITVIIANLFGSVKLAVLATLMGDTPYTNLVAFASTDDLRTLFFATTRPTRKYANLSSHPPVSLLIDNRSNNVFDFREALAVTAVGEARVVTADRRTAVREIYLRKHPYLEEFVTSPSTVFIAVDVHTYYVVRRFQNVIEFHLTP